MRQIFLALALATALSACAQGPSAAGRGGVPPNPFASNYPSAPPDAAAVGRPLRPPRDVAR